MISVVIPLYNKQEFICRAVDSVLSQTFSDFELIIVDDGSTDSGAVLVEKTYTDPRIKLIREKNAGVSVARNHGIKRASADLVAFLDADDTYEKEFLEEISKLRNNFPEAGAYATAFYTLKGDKKENLSLNGISDGYTENILEDYFSAAVVYPPFFSSSIAIKKEVFDKLGNFQPGVKMGEDTDMWMRVALEFPIAYSSKILSNYYTGHEGTATGSGIQQSYSFTYSDKLLNGKLEYYAAKFPGLKEYLNYKSLELASGLVMAGKGKEAKQILARISTERYVKEKSKWRMIAILPFPVLLLLQKIKKILR